MIGRILPPFSFILPAWLVITMVGWKKAIEVLPALLVSGGAFAAMQFYWSNFQRHDPGLVDIVAAIFSLLMTVAFLRFWKPRHLMEEGEGERTIELRHHSVGTILKGWSPFALASVFIFLWALPEFGSYLRIPFLTWPTPWLHNAVIRTPPVTPVPTPETGLHRFQLLRPARDRRSSSGRFSRRCCWGSTSAARCASWAGRSGSSCRRCSPSASWSALPTSRGTRAWTP